MNGNDTTMVARNDTAMVTRNDTAMVSRNDTAMVNRNEMLSFINISKRGGLLITLMTLNDRSASSHT